MKKESAGDIFEPEIPVVPDDWALVPFERAAQVVPDRGKRVKQGSYLPSGKIPVIDQGQDYIGGYIDDDTVAFEGQLPVVLFGDHTRSIKYVDKRFAVGAEGVKILRPADCYEPKFFYYLLQSLRIPSRGYSRHFQFLRRFHFPVAPKPQQERIVAEIEKQFSRLDEAVTNLKRVKANLKRYKAALLKAAIEGKLTEEWRKAHPDVEPASELLKRILAERTSLRKNGPLDVSRFPQLPAGWSWARIEDLGDVQLGRQRAPKYHRGSHMRPYLRVQNVFEDRIDLGDVMEMDFPPSDFAKFQLKPDDILLNEGQSPELLGRPAIYRGELPGACFTNTLIRCRPYLPMRSEYPLLVFRAYMRTGRFTKEGTITTNIAHLSAGRFAKIEFPVPPLEEQKEIVNEAEMRLSAIDVLDNEINKQYFRADRLRQSVLQRAFAGKLKFEGGNTVGSLLS